MSNKERLKQLGWGKAEPGRQWKPVVHTRGKEDLGFKRVKNETLSIASDIEKKAEKYHNRGNDAAHYMLMRWVKQLRGVWD